MTKCICERSCGENRTDPDCPECAPRIAAWREEAKQPKKAAPKFTREWRHKAKVEKVTLNNGNSHFVAAFKRDGIWDFIENRDPQSGNTVTTQFADAPAAHEAAKAAYIRHHGVQTAKRERVL